jgi:beta-glucanase (GH16 family)
MKKKMAIEKANRSEIISKAENENESLSEEKPSSGEMSSVKKNQRGRREVAAKLNKSRGERNAAEEEM